MPSTLEIFRQAESLLVEERDLVVDSLRDEVFARVRERGDFAFCIVSIELAVK